MKASQPRHKQNNSTIVVTNSSQALEENQYYAPQDIDDIVVDNLKNSALPRQETYNISLDNVHAVSIPNRWGAVQEFDITLIYGKCELHTFKKLRKFGNN